MESGWLWANVPQINTPIVTGAQVDAYTLATAGGHKKL